MNFYTSSPKQIKQKFARKHYSHERWCFGAYAYNHHVCLTLCREILSRESEKWCIAAPTYDVGVTWKFWKQFGVRKDWYDGEYGSFQFLFLWIGWYR